MCAAGCGRSMCVPLEESSKLVITDRQMNCILVSQTNEGADFDGAQRRLRNVWREQTVAWEAFDKSLKELISAALKNITQQYHQLVIR